MTWCESSNTLIKWFVKMLLLKYRFSYWDDATRDTNVKCYITEAFGVNDVSTVYHSNRQHLNERSIIIRTVFGCRRGSQKMVRFLVVSKWRLRMGVLRTKVVVYRAGGWLSLWRCLATGWRHSHKAGSWVETRALQWWGQCWAQMWFAFLRCCFHTNTTLCSSVDTLKYKSNVSMGFIYFIIFLQYWCSNFNHKCLVFSSGPTWKPSPLLHSTA